MMRNYILRADAIKKLGISSKAFDNAVKDGWIIKLDRGIYDIETVNNYLVELNYRRKLRRNK